MTATNNNWVIPVWWDQFILDRTVGIQFLIAKCQQILGETSFEAYLPTTIASILMLFFTYKMLVFFYFRYLIIDFELIKNSINFSLINTNKVIGY